MTRLTLALDVMGGDFGPRITIPASIKALEADPMLHLLLFGDTQQITPFLAQVSDSIKARMTLCHCMRTIASNQSVTQAIRQSKGSSMRLAIEAVQKGEAQGCVSAGNTGALMGLAKVILQPLKGIARPALISMLPTVEGKRSVMLDLGANVDCHSEHLYQFALMGSIFAENTLGLVYPRVALLNIGIEEIKGYKSIRDAAEILQKSTALNYTGFIEGDQLLNGQADVIVSDGFIGNIALKTMEGTAKNMAALLFSQRKSHSYKQYVIGVLGRLFKFFCRQHYQRLNQVNPEQYNGASLIGLTAVVVKSHGSATENAFFYAIKDATLQARNQIPAKIFAGLEKI